MGNLFCKSVGTSQELLEYLMPFIKEHLPTKVCQIKKIHFSVRSQFNFDQEIILYVKTLSKAGFNIRLIKSAVGPPAFFIINLDGGFITNYFLEISHSLLSDIKVDHLFCTNMVQKIYVTDECVICEEKKSTLIIFPCGHQCLCFSCKDKVSLCPLCRGEILSLVS